VRIFVNTRVREITKAKEFVLHAGEDEFRTQALVVATGGLSLPKIGATSFGYDLARRFRLAICEPRPALVPLVFKAADRERYCDLTGVSTEVIASCGRQSFREKMLVTHRGLSGPAILQISSYWMQPEAITIDLAPGHDVTAALRAPGAARNLAAAKVAFRAFMPQRLADRWLDLHAPARWTNTGLEDLERRVHQWEIVPAGTEGYEKAEVTAGGISTDELSAQTMECRNVPGLFFIGEVVDVTGHLGGFNFQWAWASGFCAGQAV
jgi:predicted Rossmann fold flavoprotein